MLKELVENIIWQADYFLKESGEFYPFASILSKEEEIKPMGILLENDKPSPEEVLMELNRVLNSGLINHEIKGYAIGINTTYKLEKTLTGNSNPEMDSKIGNDAIEIRFRLDPELEEEIIRLPYILNDQTREILFGDFIQDSE